MTTPGVTARRAVPVLAPVGAAVASLAIVLLAWMLFLRVFHVSPLMAKSPAAVAHYLVGGHAAGPHRARLLAALATTLGHTAWGFALGLAAGVMCAILFVLFPPVEQGLLPAATILRAVPLVAMTPLIVMVFGRGSLAVAVIGAVVVFFPTLVNVTMGLRAAPQSATDLVRAYGGGAGTVLRKVGVPAALPALFASMRLSAPAALVGALLAEWLATGDGLGNRMQRDISTFQSTDLWAAVALATLCSLAMHGLIGLGEALVLQRFTAR